MENEFSHIRVLVIAKGRGLRDYIAQRVLLPNRYEPILARDGVDGVRRALAQVPDLILMEDALPKLSGQEVLETLHSRPLQIPVILLTTHQSRQIELPLLRMGVRDYVTKPFTADELLESIRRVTFEVQLRREKIALARRATDAEGKTKRCLVELSIFQKIGEAVVSRMPLDVLLERITEAARYIARSDECFLVLNDPETGEQAEKVIKRQKGGVVRPLVPNSNPEPGQPGTVIAMLHIPLRVGEREIGVLGVNNKSALRSFSDHERQLLSMLADYAAIAIQLVKLSNPVDTALEKGS